jgi:tetratricopeptide (TPR) repeat protein
MVQAGWNWRRWAVAALLAGIVLGGAIFLRKRASTRLPVPAATLAEDDVDLPLPENPGYVGPQACAVCHAARVAQLEKTNHFLACREPRPGTMPEGFRPGKGTFIAREAGLRFEMTQSGDDFLHTAVQPLAAGGEKTASTRIAWVYGAGDADEVYFGWHGDRLYELPVSWLHPQQRWGIAPRYRYSTEEDFSRDATPRCVECHNTWVGHIPGTLNQYQREGLILGVTCERCHGPGREHVAFHQAHPEAKVGESIVHPGRLTRERQMDLCTQCHSNAIKYRAPAFSYRPGQPLETAYKTLAPKQPEDDHVANQTHYLRQSKCFQQGDDLTCVTCHHPHRPKSPAATAAVQNACLKCHAPAACGEQARLPPAVRGDCTGCHMPNGIKINVHFHTEDDEYVAPILRSQHRIGIYPAARQAVLLGWYRTQSDAKSRQEATRLAQELVAHWLAEADRCRKAYRIMAVIAALREAWRVDPTPAIHAELKEAMAVVDRFEADSIAASRQFHEKRYSEAMASYQRILRVKPDAAIVHGKLGLAYYITGRRDQGAEELLAVSRYDPDEPYGLAELGWLKYLQGKHQEAVDLYRRANEIEPYDATILSHWGLALLKFGHSAEAVDRLHRAVAIDPRNVGACQALSIALRRQGKFEESIDFATRAARLTHYASADVLMHLAEAYAEARRHADVDDAVAKALEAARRNNPDLLPMIHERGEELRLRANQPPEQE